jgi:hypothetical protein
MKLLQDTMNDGSRNFLLLPTGSTPPIRLVFRVLSLWGAYPTAYIPSLGESWIDFRYKRQKFSINNQYGDFWFFVESPKCPDSVLLEVANHFEKILCVHP